MAPSVSSTSPTRANAATSLVSSSVPQHADPTPSDLLLSTPPAVLKLLSLCAPIIHALNNLCELLTWSGRASVFSSLLVLLGWWLICLGGQFLVRYGLNALLLGWLLLRYVQKLWQPRPPPGQSKPLPSYRKLPTTMITPASYAALLSSSSMLAGHVQTLRAKVIHPISAQLSFVPPGQGRATPAFATAWLALTSYPFYLLLTWAVPMRVLFLVAGSVAILWQAPFFRVLRSVLWRSAAVRCACRILFALLRGGHGLRREWAETRKGVGLPALFGGPKRRSEVEERPVKVAKAGAGEAGAGAGEDGEGGEAGEDVQVQFTVFENQRWWVGLDWTHALLPGERASWTDPALNPANPPSSFILPPPSISYTPAPTKADPNARMKRTTEWRWLDPEWAVLRTPSANLIAAAAAAAQHPPPLARSLSNGTAAESLSSVAAQAASTTADSSALAAQAPVPSPAKSTFPSVSSLSSFASSVTLSSGLNPASPIPATPSSTAPGAAGSSASSSTEAPAPLPVGSGQELPFGPALGDAAGWANWPGVDEEGWQYGDNHFEKMGPKGGLGKYTRKRAWIRRAGLVERCERVPGPSPEETKAAAAADKPKTTANVGPSAATATRRTSMIGSLGLGMAAGGVASSLRDRSASGSRERPALSNATATGASSPTKLRAEASGSLTAALGGAGADVRRRRSAREGSTRERRSSSSKVAMDEEPDEK